MVDVADVLARVHREMQERLREIEAELAGVEPLIAEKAQIEHALSAPPFADYAEGESDSTPTGG